VTDCSYVVDFPYLNCASDTRSPDSRQQRRLHLPVVTPSHKVSRLPRIILEVEQQVGLVMTRQKLLIRIMDRFMETLDRNACDLLTLACQFADGTGLQTSSLDPSRRLI
jgi:hypothetical protein